MSIFGTITYILRSQGVKGLMYLIISRVRILFGIRSASFRSLEVVFDGKKGIEFGGPSQVFTCKGIFPLYPIIAHLDNCNFSCTTVWEGDIKDGQTFRFNSNKPNGRQYIGEATSMECLPSNLYDFVLASHILEHIANPLRALFEWIRLLKEYGMLVVLLPHKNGSFDHRRPVTTLEHIIADFACGMTENDLTHLPEILALHDLKRDPEAGSSVAFKARSLCNYKNRCFHHHVFDTQLAILLMDYAGMGIKAVEEILPTHILIVAEKLPTGSKPNNKSFINIKDLS